MFRQFRIMPVNAEFRMNNVPKQFNTSIGYVDIKICLNEYRTKWGQAEKYLMPLRTFNYNFHKFAKFDEGILQHSKQMSSLVIFMLFPQLNSLNYTTWVLLFPICTIFNSFWTYAVYIYKVFDQEIGMKPNSMDWWKLFRSFNDWKAILNGCGR